MANNTTLNTGSGGDVVATEDIGGVKYQQVKVTDGRTGNTTNKLAIFAEDNASADGDTGILAFARRTAAPINTSGTDGDYETLQMDAGKLWVAPLGFPITVKVSVTRPADVLQYAAGDAISDSTSAPTAGGFTITNAGRKSGGSCIITDVCVTSDNDPATRLAGEIFIWDQSVTNINDNVAFGVTDAEMRNCVGVIPFSLFDSGNNGYCHVMGLNMMATCVGTANLRFLLRTRNAYTPASAEVIQVAFKILQVD